MNVEDIIKNTHGLIIENKGDKYTIKIPTNNEEWGIMEDIEETNLKALISIYDIYAKETNIHPYNIMEIAIEIVNAHEGEILTSELIERLKQETYKQIIPKTYKGN